MQRKIIASSHTHQNNQLNCHLSLERVNSKEEISFNEKCNSESVVIFSFKLRYNVLNFQIIMFLNCYLKPVF